MTPAARVAAAIVLLDEVIDAARDGGAAADTLAQRFFAGRRYAGSKDRRAVRELVWRAIRAFADLPSSGRAAMATLADADPDLAALFDGSGYGAPALLVDEPRAKAGGAVPRILRDALYPVINGAEAAALVERAPVDARINRARLGDVDLPDDGAPLPAPLDGVRFAADTDLTLHPAYANGGLEIQDAGSQWIAHACGVRPGMRVVDLCAGAGGKTLALEAAMAGEGVLLACDTDRRRLDQLVPRAVQAGAEIIETRLLNPKQEAAMLTDWHGNADVVLIDAPCSGSGTWRRNPEARWRITRDRLLRLQAEQTRLLAIGAELVATGGALVYAVCALTRAEGADIVSDFLSRNPSWTVEQLHESGQLPPGVGRSAGAGVVLTPLHDHSDGFFLAKLRAP